MGTDGRRGVLAIWRRLWDMPGWMRVLLAGQVVNSAGGLAWIYLSLYLVSDRGLSPSLAGVVSAGYGAGLIGGSLAGGWFGDRFGLRRSLIVSAWGWVALCLLVPLSPGPVLPATVAAAGFVGGSARPVIYALVGAALPPQRRREGMALQRTATNLGFTIGPPLGALAAAYDFGLVFVVDAAATAVFAGVVWFVVPRADRPVRPGRTGPRFAALRSAARDPRVLAVLLTVLVVDTVYRQILTPLPLLLRDLGYPPLAYGVLMAANAAIIVAFEAPIAVVLRRRAATAVIAAGYLLVGLGFLVIGASPSLVAAAVAMVVLTGGEMLYKPTATAHVADAAPAGMTARYQSLYSAASITGMMAAPALGGLAYQHAPGLLWPVAAGLATGCAVVLLGVARRRVPAAVPTGTAAAA